ncbi:MAG: glycosyltransferase, partial [Lachnospiraceae bacterium]|nr:glycosyltransferase [Lachnospiraceae bacterium]
MNMKVSIIMPVYNSEEYLSKAVDSVLAQDFDGFELILVDDGSPDGSGAICDDYAARFNNVKVVHKENGGICSARNAGLDVAEGEYIGFCDNDDEYLQNLIRDNYNYAKEHNVDLMRYAKIKRLEREDGKVWETVGTIEDMCIERSEFGEHYENIRREHTIWTAFYRKSIIDEFGIRFDTNIKYGSEDLFFNLEFLLHCQILGFNSKAYYVWTQRETHSTSRKYNRQQLFDVLSALDIEYKFMHETCGGKLNEFKKNTFLANTYILMVLDYMNYD